MEINLLPIGSIVFLKEGQQKLLIINRIILLEQNNEKVLFDYSACMYPYGMDPDKTFYFNNEDIEKIIFEGYRDEEEMEFIKVFEKWLDDEGNIFPKGKTH